MNVTELARILHQVSQNFPTAPIRVQAWNDSGDLQDIRIKGDVRLERDEVGTPVVVIR